MKKIAMIGCVKSKTNKKSKVRDLYTSDLFKKSLNYVLQNFDEKNIYVLSAKYGLVHINEELEPYEETLNDKKDKDIKDWALKVNQQLSQIIEYADELYFYAGKNYYKHLMTLPNKIYLPLGSLGIGSRLKWLKENTK